MHRFDYTFLDDGLLPASIAGLAAEVYALQARADIRRYDHPNVFTELESIAKIQSVRDSNAIEGIVTTDGRVASIVRGDIAPRGHDEEEIAGYSDALAMVHEGHQALDLRVSDILRLHRAMLGYTAASDAGSFKTQDNLIIEVAENGNRRVRFEPVPAAETPAAVEQMVLAYQDARSNPHINQLLLTPCVVLDFLCIHPFRDGNGRISRLLSLLLLYKSGFDAGKYVSFESQVNAAKGAYYRVLEQSSAGWHSNENDYAPFMKNFLTVLYRCYKELDSRFVLGNSKRVTKTERIEQAVLNALAPVSKAELCELLPDVSPTTVEAVLGKMVKSGSIRRVGQGRASRYIRAD